ncbi:hypothetical protein [Aureimonas mangrovi]|uniref:hypothetical protein n=1 Tax=Aureimonas mangrovi TaxID=2758041 RepID=UPI00163D3EC0|nr:hypothetical protein [Aureimonas mangrovi]
MSASSFFAVNTLSLFLAFSALILALRKMDSWGWFLFAALLTFSGATILGNQAEAVESAQRHGQAAHPHLELNSL